MQPFDTYREAATWAKQHANGPVSVLIGMMTTSATWTYAEYFGAYVGAPASCFHIEGPFGPTMKLYV